MKLEIIQILQSQLESCETTGYDPNNHFYGATKMIKLGSGARRAIPNGRVN